MSDNITIQRALQQQADVHRRFRLVFQKMDSDRLNSRTPFHQETKRESRISILSFTPSSDLVELAIPTEPMKRDSFVPRLWKLGNPPWEEGEEPEPESISILQPTIRRVVSEDFPSSSSESEGEAISPPSSVQDTFYGYASNSSSPSESKRKPIRRLLRKISQLSLSSNYNLAKEITSPTTDCLTPDYPTRSPSKFVLSRFRKLLVTQESSIRNMKISDPVLVSIENKDALAHHFVLPTVRPVSSIDIHGISNGI
ncbi:hypothetical protein NEOLI_004407 [Neolecta irregularis DAH-3]|uniref:Uncharacterized protein n=1 Tax=Neolecta irregularis (strain DAH-3) TaxID=1198029 RepID=A0A1U7LGG3_NEOID|nr:hypothetical protein NEOLI_004407 [Neolecta irregularis DAH-3]|eukprot:OLL21745.1 hypothetical protein NEOLI_004407 [Neolecta irregularis DAH-3]